MYLLLKDLIEAEDPDNTIPLSSEPRDELWRKYNESVPVIREDTELTKGIKP